MIYCIHAASKAECVKVFRSYPQDLVAGDVTYEAGIRLAMIRSTVSETLFLRQSVARWRVETYANELCVCRLASHHLEATRFGNASELSTAFRRVMGECMDSVVTSKYVAGFSGRLASGRGSCHWWVVSAFWGGEYAGRPPIPVLPSK